MLFTPKHAGGIVELGRQLIQQSSPDVAAVVENDLALLLATALDQAAINGPGGIAPTGVLNTPGIGSVALGANGGAPSYAAAIQLIGQVDAANALAGSLGFVTNARAVRTMRQTPRTANDTASNFVMNDPSILVGYPLMSSQDVPSTLTKDTGTGLSALIFADWSQLMIGMWSELDILVNPYADSAYPKGAVQVRAMLTTDIHARQPAAFAAITDMIAA